MRNSVFLFFLTLGILGCDGSKQDKSETEASAEKNAPAASQDEVLDPEDCDDKAAKVENKAEEAMMNLQGDADAGCAIE